MHENHANMKLPSNHSFGAMWIVVFVLFSIWQGYLGSIPWMSFWIVCSLAVAIITLVRPNWLTCLNRAWMKIGSLLGRFVNPILLGSIYILLIVPVGFFMRLAGRDVMNRCYLDTPSYWAKREDGILTSDNFNNQF